MNDGNSNCERFRDQVSGYVAGELVEALSLGFRSHEADCAACRDLAHRERRLNKILPLWEVPDLDPVQRERWVARLMRRLLPITDEDSALDSLLAQWVVPSARPNFAARAMARIESFVTVGSEAHDLDHLLEKWPAPTPSASLSQSVVRRLVENMPSTDSPNRVDVPKLQSLSGSPFESSMTTLRRLRRPLMIAASLLIVFTVAFLLSRPESDIVSSDDGKVASTSPLRPNSPVEPLPSDSFDLLAVSQTATPVFSAPRGERRPATTFRRAVHRVSTSSSFALELR